MNFGGNTLTLANGGFNNVTIDFDPAALECGNGAMDLYLKIYEIRRMPYLDYDPKDREANELMMYPKMDGKRVFLNAVRGMVMSTQAALAKTGLSWDDVQWFVPHQANLRIN